MSEQCSCKRFHAETWLYGRVVWLDRDGTIYEGKTTHCPDCGDRLTFAKDGTPVAEPMVPKAALDWLAKNCAGPNNVCPAPFPWVVTPECCPHRGTGSTTGCDMSMAASCWIEAALAAADADPKPEA